MNRWDTADLPILQAVYKMENQQRQPGNLDKLRLAEVANVGYEELIRSLGYLAADRLINVIDAGSHDGPDYLVEGITPDGLRCLSQWPSDERLAAILPAVLDELAQQSEDEVVADAFRRAGSLLAGIRPTALVTLVRSLCGLDVAP